MIDHAFEGAARGSQILEFLMEEPEFPAKLQRIVDKARQE